MKRFLDRLLFIRPDGGSLPAQQRANVIVLYTIAIATLIAIPTNLQSDWVAGDFVSAFFDAFFLASVLAAVGVFLITRVVRQARYFLILGIFALVGYLVVNAGGARGFGFLYFITGFSLLYFVLGFRGGLLFAGFFLVGILIRLNFFPVSDLSLYRDPDTRFHFLLVYAVATLLGVVAVFYQNYLVNYLSKIAYQDPVTGRPNRNRLSEILRLAIQADRPFHLVSVKTFNLSSLSGHHGMAITDAVLKELGRRLVDCLPTGVLCGRWSGAIFLLRLEKHSLADLQKLTHDILRSTSEPIVHGDLEITLQVGVAVTHYPQDGTNLDRLVGNLTTTLHLPEDRIGRVSFFNEKDWVAEQRRFVIASALKGAVGRNEFHLVYHPKVRLSDRCCSGAEVLIRWNSRDLGPVSPGEFIPVAEASGSINEITDYLLRRFMADYRQISAIGPVGRQIVHAVNLSPLDLVNSHLPAKLVALCRNHDLDPQRIELEITEGTMMSNDPALLNVLKELRTAGFSLAIDDFGTGYSSLSYLHRIEASNLKIDQSFIRQIGPDSVILPIIEAILSMGHSLGLVVTAEGVETEDQAVYLQARGCDYGQGWLFAHPLELPAYLAWLHAAEKIPADQPAAP